MANSAKHVIEHLKFSLLIHLINIFFEFKVRSTADRVVKIRNKSGYNADLKLEYLNEAGSSIIKQTGSIVSGFNYGFCNQTLKAKLLIKIV